jgi:circadian clock protein KaiC
LSYEESAGQLIQNMSSIGFYFEPLMKKGLLKIVSIRPSFFGLEMHLLDLYKIIADFKPKAIVIDPLTSLLGQGNQLEIRSMLTRLIDALKSKGITGFFTSLVSSTKENDNSGEIGVSSLIDTWIVVRELEDDNGKRRVRGLYIVKSRGTKHSSDVHKLILSDDGITLIPMDNVGTARPNKKKNPNESVSGTPKLIKKDKGT